MQARRNASKCAQMKRASLRRFLQWRFSAAFTMFLRENTKARRNFSKTAADCAGHSKNKMSLPEKPRNGNAKSPPQNARSPVFSRRSHKTRGILSLRLPDFMNRKGQPRPVMRRLRAAARCGETEFARLTIRSRQPEFLPDQRESSRPSARCGSGRRRRDSPAHCRSD